MRRSRTLWSFVAATVVAALVVAAVVSSRPSGEDECLRWQERYRAALEAGGGAGGTLDFVNMGPMAELERDKPEGCETPAEP